MRFVTTRDFLSLLAVCLVVGIAQAGTEPATIPAHFWISNQSLGTGIDAVQMTVRLDGSQIFDALMAVDGQHNYEFVDLDVTPGPHTVEVDVGDPYSLSETTDLDLPAESWILVRFWFDPVSAHAAQRTPTITVDVLDHNPGIK